MRLPSRLQFGNFGFTAGSSRNKYFCPLAVASHPDHTRDHKVIADTNENFANNGTDNEHDKNISAMGNDSAQNRLRYTE